MKKIKFGKLKYQYIVEKNRLLVRHWEAEIQYLGTLLLHMLLRLHLLSLH